MARAGSRRIAADPADSATGIIPRGVAFLTAHAEAVAWILAILATLVAAVAIVTTGDRVKSMDEPDFLAIARSVAFEGRFAINGEATAYRAPGLIFFLAPFARFGLGLMELRLVNALLLGGGLILVFHLVRRHAGPLAGLFAVAMIPLWPVTIYTATTLYPQTLATFLLVLTLYLADRLRDDGGWGRVIAAGVSFGALILTVPVVLLLTPVLAAWVWWCGRSLVRAVVFVAVAALVTLGWTARNYAAFGAFVPVATSSGYNLMAGNAPDARFDSSLDVRFPEYVYTELTGASEVEANDILQHAALKQMAENPGRTLRLTAGKFLHWFDWSNRLLSDDVVEGGASGLGAGLRDRILLVTWALVIMLPLAIRLAMLRSMPLRPLEWVALALWVTAGLAYALFFTRVRFRLPFDWPVIAMNGMFVAALVEGWVRRKRRK